MNSIFEERVGGSTLIMTHAGIYEVGPASDLSNSFYLSSDRQSNDEVFKIFKESSLENCAKNRQKVIDWLSQFAK